MHECMNLSLLHMDYQRSLIFHVQTPHHMEHNVTDITIVYNRSTDARFPDNLANDQYRKMHEEKESDDIEWDIEDMKRAIIESAEVYDDLVGG